MLGYRPALPGHLPAQGQWRSTAPVQAGALPAAKDRVSNYTIRRQPVSRSSQVVASARRIDRPVGLSPTSLRAQLNWRPTAASATLASAPPPRAFRPVAYGRPAGATGHLASTLPSNSASAARQLPGWVTTLHDSDSDSADLCSWCGGS